MLQTINSDSQYRYRLTMDCLIDSAGDVCFNPRACATDGEQGILYNVYRALVGTSDWQFYGTACLTNNQSEQLGLINWEMVEEAFRTLEWPDAPLSVQPPDGETLINFETNFFTTLDQPVTQNIQLLGQAVQIIATPVEYNWRFGDGATLTTSTPGAAYPDLEVTHEYVAPGDVGPSVDVTYAGQGRINGGPLRDLTSQVTVPGLPVDVAILEAAPKLVG